MKPNPDKDFGEINCLSDISPRDKPWDVHRAMSDEISQLYLMAGNDRYSERIDKCSQVLKFCLEAINPQEFRLRLRQAQFCRVRHCAVCQWRRSLMWRGRFIKALPEIHKTFPKGQWIFLTLTVRNCHIKDLNNTLKNMNEAWKRLIQRKIFPALGFIKSVEVTKGKDKTAHPHFHCMLLVKSSYFTTGYISQEKWTELWKSCLRIDYTPIVHIQRVKVKSSSKKTNIFTSESDSQNAIIKAICETLKYSVKEADLVKDAWWLDELTRQLHNTRAIAIGGCLRDFIKEDEPDDLINTELEDAENSLEPSEDETFLLFDWASQIRRYQRRH